MIARNLQCLAVVAVSLLSLGCASVDVTKTAKGFYDSTRPDEVEILMTVPARRYIELATISTSQWDPNETAKMHNALRAKSAPLGAHAVVITQSGIVMVYDSPKLWCTGFALRYEGAPEQLPSASRPSEPR